MPILNSSAQFLLLILAAMCAIGAAILTSKYIHGWTSKGKTVIVREQKFETSTVVVASQPLRYGTELSSSNLREMEWPKDSLPHGAVQKINEIMKRKGKTVALSYIEVGEPVLSWKITGPGQRASLSAMLKSGSKAVSIRVNEVLGVGGFVLPGDHVDVLLTRNENKKVGGQDVNHSYTDVLLQNVRVLGVDQVADDKNDKPALAKTVTVEVGIKDAQKLVLASSIGVLSLTLRRAGAMVNDVAQRVTLSDLTFGGQEPQQTPAPAAEKKTTKNSAAMISVTRELERSEYQVHRE